MTTAIQRSRAHLGDHRRMIVLRSLAVGLAGMTPVPYLDDWLAATIRRQTLRRIAEARRVDLDRKALFAIADGKVPPPTLKTLMSASLLPRLSARGFKKLLILWVASQRAQQALNSFALATLFDHYCAQLHVGAGITEARGRELRDAMDRVIAGARSRTVLRLFKRALAAGARAALRAPLEIMDIASGGLVRKLRRRGDEAEVEAEAVDVVEQAVGRAEADSFMAKLTTAVERTLGAAGGAYVDEIVGAFESELERAGA